MGQAALWGLAVAAAVAFATWLASLRLRDVSLVDRVWSWMIVAPAFVYATLLPDRAADGARLGMLAIGAAWALRLSAYVWWRNRGHGEDRRYRAIRERHGAGFPRDSLVTVFGLQAVLAWVVSTPFLAAFTSAPGSGRGVGAGVAAGAVLAVAGVVLEAVADAQMARFRRRRREQPDEADAVMDRGLWRWSRHPNYFGEACVWWGLWAMAIGSAGAGAAWSVMSPLLMTVLLLRVSGVALLERDLLSRRPAYRDYVERTSAFIPWPPRRGRPA